jgi:hypothetical protein
MLFGTTMYELKKKLFIRLNRLRKWADRVSSPLRVPIRAEYKSTKKNGIFKTSAADVEILWKSPIGGKSSPVSFDG